MTALDPELGTPLSYIQIIIGSQTGTTGPIGEPAVFENLAVGAYEVFGLDPITGKSGLENVTVQGIADGFTLQLR